MSDIGKAWVDGIREPSHSELENREHHEKYSAMLSNEFDERVKKLASLLDHPRDERGGLWISAFDFESRANRRNSNLAKKEIENLNSFIPAGKEVLMCKGYHFSIQGWGGKYYLQINYKYGTVPLFYLDKTELTKQVYLDADMLATISSLREQYKDDGICIADANTLNKKFKF